MIFLNLHLQAGLLSVDRTPVSFKTEFKDEVLDFAHNFALFHLFVILSCSSHPPLHYCMIHVLIKMSAYVLASGTIQNM